MQEERAEYLAAAAKRQRTVNAARKMACAAASADFDPTVVCGWMGDPPRPQPLCRWGGPVPGAGWGLHSEA